MSKSSYYWVYYIRDCIESRDIPRLNSTLKFYLISLNVHRKHLGNNIVYDIKGNKLSF